MRVRAFSLLEVLVAAGLLALIGGLLVSSLSTSISAKEAAETSSDRYHLARQALSRMTDEISMAFMSQHVTTLEPRHRTGFKGERDRLYFTAFGNSPRVQDAKQSEQRELEYKMDFDDRTGANAIVRREQPYLDLDLDEGGRTQTLLTYVSELEFEYFDPTKESWTEQWDTENTATLNRLPSRVRIKFTTKVDFERDQERTFYTQSKILLTRPFKFQ